MNYYEFHISKNARIKFDFDKNLFALNGDLIIADFKQARLLSDKINNIRKNENHPELQITAGQLNALGLLHEIYHHIISFYNENENKGAISKSIDHLRQQLGEKELNDVLIEYLHEFPPQKVYKGIQSAKEFLEDTTYDKPNRELVLEELILLNLENYNPAVVSFKEFFSDAALSKKVKYIEVIDAAEQFFVNEKTIGKDNLHLFKFLRKPIMASPNNIEEQLDFILENWSVYVYDKFHNRILSSKDLIYEDVKLFIQHGGGEMGTPPVPNYLWEKEFLARVRAKIASGKELSKEELNFYYTEPERFTEDTDWMPQVVMIAKNAYVWLDQLSKKYRRSISRLDEIPDEELDLLAKWNFTALWLIGLWERSSASKKIKQYTGNPEAASSAYSLYDYVIANDLGGETAFENLKQRAWQRGIRMASDMVPNHTGIFSKWIIEKPDYFIQRNDPPYPAYSFRGPNLSDDERVEVRIEDKYYSKEDAAVVFQRYDNHTGEVKYIYHGNDGTNMPWNDTAQLNLLLPEVRESLIQTIMHVARKTPIIRFDAAMTLAKKHFQRLWFPQPGTGGAIPSRSDFSLTREEFENAFPEEFWREVVDRMNAEMPQTLLLAEAFWLMEGYFVRTLGMHRVYNSAFMHMMMKEENNKYRELIKNTLDFNPEILKRYVNFMSNPDEETAVNQFGKGDKYFGIAVMMITLPGLPMFGHGQVEGFAEKYGMEYKRAYYDEYVDENLVRRHETEIFPMIRKRYLFSQVNNFEFYNFIDEFGNLNENVFAFSNKAASEKTIVLFNNSYNEVKGTIKHSVPKVRNSNDVQSTTLANSLGFKNENKYFYILFDHKTKLEFLFNGSEINQQGAFFSLSGYEYHVFFNFTEVFDAIGEYQKLYKFLHGRGVHSVLFALKELNLAGVHKEIEQMVNAHNFDLMENFCFENEPIDLKKEKEYIYNIQPLPDDVQNNLNALLFEINYIQTPPADAKRFFENVTERYNAIKVFHSLIVKESAKRTSKKWTDFVITRLTSGKAKHQNDKTLFLLQFTSGFLDVYSCNFKENQEIFDKLLLEKAIWNALKLNNGNDVSRNVLLIKILSSSQFCKSVMELFSSVSNKSTKFKSAVLLFLTELFEEENLKKYLNVNVHEGVEYFGKENFSTLWNWIFTIYCYDKSRSHFLKESKIAKRETANSASEAKKVFIDEIRRAAEFLEFINIGAEESGFKTSEIKKLIEIKTVARQKDSMTKTSKTKTKIKTELPGKFSIRKKNI